MLRREILKKGEQYLKEAHRFWGTDSGEGKNVLYEEITERMSFIHHVACFSVQERRLLLFLLKRQGAVSKGELREHFGKTAGFDEIVEALSRRLLIYVRKDRALLTDRTDKVYLFPEVRRLLHSFEIFEVDKIEKHLAGLITKVSALREDINPQIRELVMLGGAMPLYWDGAQSHPSHRRGSGEGELTKCFKEGLVDIALVHNEDCFIPVWLLNNRRSQLVRVERKEVHFRQSLYLNTIVRLMDCLLFRLQEGMLSLRAISECMRRVVPDPMLRNLYHRDLEKLGIVVPEGEKVRYSDDFQHAPYEQRVGLLRRLLSDEERAALEAVKHSGYCTEVYLVSSIMRAVVLGLLPGEDGGGVDMRAEMMRVLERVKQLLFRGFLIEDLDAQLVAYNSFQVREPLPDSLIVNPDLEIIVYGDRISFHSFYVLAGFAHVLSMNEMIRFKIDQHTVWHGMAYIGDLELLLNILAKASKFPLSNTVVALLREWAGGFVRMSIRRRWVVAVESQDAKHRLYRNRWVRSNVDEAAGTTLVLKDGVNIQRFMREVRKEHVYVDFFDFSVFRE